MNLHDSVTASTLASLGVSDEVASGLAGLGVGIHLVERMHQVGVPWELVRTWLPTRALACAADAAGLTNFVNEGCDDDEITEWARLGGFETAYRLHLLGIAPSFVARFPLTEPNGLKAFLRMVQSITRTGIHVDELVWWHTAGVVSLVPPFLDQELWAQWRSMAVHHLGMRRAALCAAAGLSAHEAVQHSGEDSSFTEDALMMMAALRSGSF